MIESFGNKVAEDIWTKESSKTLPAELHERAKALLTIMYGVNSLDELTVQGTPPSLRLHKLKGNLKGRYAIDIHKTSGWRITFKFESGCFIDVKIEDYH